MVEREVMEVAMVAKVAVLVLVVNVLEVVAVNMTKAPVEVAKVALEAVAMLVFLQCCSRYLHIWFCISPYT
jgi:hypothetical protein